MGSRFFTIPILVLLVSFSSSADAAGTSTRKPVKPAKKTYKTESPVSDATPVTPKTGANPHWVGLGNIVLPGFGEFMNGNPWTGAVKATYEIGAFRAGHFL